MEVASKGRYTILKPQLANLIEDERIETILSHYYLDVDFKENLRNACPLDKHIKSFEHFLFNVIRHRCSPIMPTECNNLVDSFIESTKEFNSFTGSPYVLADRMENLLIQLKVIFDMLPKDTSADSSKGSGKGSESKSSEEDSTSDTEDSAENSSNEESNDSSETEKQSAKGNSSKEESGSAEANDSEESENSSTNGNESEEESDSQSELEQMEEKSKSLTSKLESKLSSEEVESIMQKATDTIKQYSVYANQNKGKMPVKLSDFSYDKSTKCEMLKIIGRNAGFGINKTPTQYGYNGKFNTKRFATDFNDSCKWFAKRAYEETGAMNRKNNTKVLNIWLDNSGSYSYNDLETNKILSALASIEKSREDFKFNLITFDTHFYKRNGEERLSCSTGGNALPKKEIDPIYHEVNNNGTELNIVLFDGSAVSDSYSTDSGYSSLRVFNNNKSIFITEYSNVDGIKRFAPKCKALIVENHNYCQQLTRNILKAFDLLF